MICTLSARFYYTFFKVFNKLNVWWQLESDENKHF